MKVLLYRNSGRAIQEFELRSAHSYFILVEKPDGEGHPIKETLFRQLTYGPVIGHYVEGDIKEEFFKKRATEALQRSNYDYAKEMNDLGRLVSEKPPPIPGKIERYAAWPRPNYVQAYQPKTKSIFADDGSIVGVNKIKPDPYVTIANNPKWDAPYQTTYVSDDEPFSNVVYTQKPEPAVVPVISRRARYTPKPEPAVMPDLEVIGEPKKRLILIQKEEINETVTADPALAGSGEDAGDQWSGKSPG